MTRKLLADCVARLAPDVLVRVARQAGVEADSRSGLERALVTRLTEPTWQAEVVQRLTPEEWQALKVIYWGGGGEGMTVELCQQVVNLLGGRRRQGAAQAITTLMDRGLVYTCKQGYREVYVVPTELLPAVQKGLAAQMMEQVRAPAPEYALDPAGPDLVEELYRFLAYIYRTEVQLTQQGVMFKRHLRTLAQLLGLASAAGGEDDLLPGRYPEPLGFVTGFSLDHHLATCDGGLLQPGADLDRWLQRSDPELRFALFDHWQGRYHYPDLQAFLHLLRTVDRLWISVPAAARELEPVLPPSQRAAVGARLHHHLSHFLAPLSVVELARTADGDLLCRLTAAGQALLAPCRNPGNNPDAGAQLPVEGLPSAGSYRFVLQPTGEVVAPRPLPLPVLWHLEVIADLEQRGPALIYRISRDSIYQALRAGYGTEEILAILGRHSSTGVPQNLAFDIATWGRAYGQVYFQEACLLRCTDPVLAQQIKAGHRTGRFIHGEVSTTALIIHRGDYEPLVQALLAEGLLPRPGIEVLPDARQESAYDAPPGQERAAPG